MSFEISETTQQRLEQVCRKYHVRKLSIFGSTLHGDARLDSDLDVLVEFVPGRTHGFAFAGLERELSGIFQRQVDLRTPNDLSRDFRDFVVKEAQAFYVTN